VNIAIGLLLALLLAACGAPVQADIRCCKEPERNREGNIVRSKAVVGEFMRLYPLPEGVNRKDYQINHAVPLVCGGLDIVENMLWMHVKAKTCEGDFCQDRIEQIVMCPRSYRR